ncbi:MAG: hypothetical protein ACRDRT_02655 [Pseudonocardiaceae bacterium]
MSQQLPDSVEDPRNLGIDLGDASCFGQFRGRDGPATPSDGLDVELTYDLFRRNKTEPAHRVSPGLGELGFEVPPYEPDYG